MMGNWMKWVYICLLLSAILGLLWSCGSGSQSLRIRTDKSGRANARMQEAGSERDRQDSLYLSPVDSMEVTRESPEELANRVLNLTVKAQEDMVAGDYQGAETQLLKALETVSSSALYFLLANVYELQGREDKADSCRQLAGREKLMK